MNIKEAYQNLMNVIAAGRIEMPAGPLTGQEHAVLQQSLQWLHTKALDAEETKSAKKEKTPKEIMHEAVEETKAAMDKKED